MKVMKSDLTRTAIIGGSGIHELPGRHLTPQTVETPYGQATLFYDQDHPENPIFLPRHGIEHRIPPHKINYRANIFALQHVGVKAVIGLFTVGSLQRTIPPGSIVCLDQFIDFSGRSGTTFFDGEETGVAHTDMTEPFCLSLSGRILALAKEHVLEITPRGTYVCVSGPRLETTAEIRLFAQLGGDVIGMTCIPEVPLARELGIHYAALAISVNWGAGLRSSRFQTEYVDFDEKLLKIVSLLNEILPVSEFSSCPCESAVLWTHKPENRH